MIEMYLISCLQSLSRWVKKGTTPYGSGEPVAIVLTPICGSHTKGPGSCDIRETWRHQQHLVFHGTICELGTIFPLSMRLRTHRNALMWQTCTRTIKLFFEAG